MGRFRLDGSPIGDTLYGTTYGADGTVFKVSLSGKEHVLYSFHGPPSDGESPAAGLTFLDGKLYGTTYAGGAHGFGTIFQATKFGGEKVLYSFKGSPKDGANPFGALTAMSHALFGTTLSGGKDVNGDPHPDAGTIFRITP